MATDEENVPGGPAPLPPERALDELDYLATVEHALCVEYLLIYCALGHDMPPAHAGAR